jgi:hypothetical protein
LRKHGGKQVTSQGREENFGKFTPKPSQNHTSRQYGTASDAKRLRELEEENQRLKRVVTDLSLDKQMLKDVLSKSW